MFPALGVEEFSWLTCADGRCQGGTGLQASCEDVAKLALLYLNEGEWAGRRVLPRDWVHMAAVSYTHLFPLILATMMIPWQVTQIPLFITWSKLGLVNTFVPVSYTHLVGHGYDVHRLVEGRKLILGGVEIPYEKGLLGHSDADVLAHAVAL